MRKNGFVVPEALQREIRSSAAAFAGELVSIVVQAVADSASGFGKARPQAPARRAPAPKARPKAKAAVAAKAAPAPRATAAASGGALESSLLGLLKKSKGGLGAEAINKALGTKTPQIARPLQNLLASGKISRSGQARGTRYHAAG
jgi:hypothetical protein